MFKEYLTVVAIISIIVVVAVTACVMFNVSGCCPVLFIHSSVTDTR